MSRYANHASSLRTPQTEPVPGREQELSPNTAGGYTFTLDCWKRLERFLILGCEGGSYYAAERALTLQNATCVRECIDSDPQRTIDTILQVSTSGRAPKQSPAIFALAVAAANPKAASLALAALPQVCRIPTHLFDFLSASKHLRGRGRAFNRAVRNWYMERPLRELAYHMAKYQQRDGWTHRDVLRLVKPYAERGSDRAALFGWACNGKLTASSDSQDLRPVIGLELAKLAASADQIVKLINDYRLVRECIPSQWLNDAKVWAALAREMPYMAMIRSLAKMSSVGLLTPMSDAVTEMSARIADAELIAKSRIHPYQVLLALATYSRGRGVRGSLEWDVDGSIASALDTAFYASFENAPVTGKRWLLGLDVSGSMGWSTIGGILKCSEAAAAIAMTVVRREDRCHVCAFANEFRQLSLNATQSLPEVLRKTSCNTFGRTDCSVPMTYATRKRIPVDVFCVLTDNETYAGEMHPFQALRKYRSAMNIPAKLIVVGMTATEFTIADPKDAGMLDVVGFDAAAPALMADFAKG